jgi:diguanylate cyclase (GGDEF)-like protein/PAS domain S-box-containing protein
MATAGPSTPIRPARGWRHLVRLGRLERLSPLWQLLLLGTLLLALIWGTVQWQTRQDEAARQTEFRQGLLHLNEILDETLVRQLDGIDNALLILRRDYLLHRNDLARTVDLLRHGPLKGLDVQVTVIGRNGYSEFSDVAGYRAPVYLGDRPHFRHFADGGIDQLYISEPVLGRITQRWGIQMARPILDGNGRFLGVIVIFLPPEELTRFMQPLAAGADTIMSVFSPEGVLLSRSIDLDQHLGSRLPRKLLADYQRERSGFVIRRSALDQVERGIAHRWIAPYPLLLVVARRPEAMLAELRDAQLRLLWIGLGASLLVVLSLGSVGYALHRRQLAERQLAREHRHLTEAQRIAGLGSWEYDPETARWSWSDEVFRMLEVERQSDDPPARVLFGLVHPEDRAVVSATYERALKNSTAFDISYRIYTPGGRTKWLHARGNRSAGLAGHPVMAGTLQDITTRKHDEAAREALSRERLLLLESTGEDIYGIDRNGRCTFINQAASRMLGYEVAEIIGRDIHALVHHTRADGSPYPLQDCPVYRTSNSGQAIQAVQEVFWRKDGNPLYVEYSAHPIRDADAVSGTVVIFSDIGERRRTEAEMRIAATAFETQEGIFITDAQGTILRVNSAFTDITGYSAAEVVGKNPRFRSSGRHDAAFYNAMWSRLKSSGAWKGEIWNRRKNGEIYPESVTITAVRGDDDSVSHYVATMHDITERKLAEEETQRLAFYDPLTALPNRRLLHDRLQQALATSGRSKHHGALMFIDLDNFKQLNDTLGHDIGDLLLQQVARRLQDCVRQADTVARLGGDEFVVLLQELSINAAKASEQAVAVGHKILATLNEPYQLGSHHFRSTPSIGVALFLDQQQGVAELLKQADLAMYQAKAAGRNTLRFYSREALDFDEGTPPTAAHAPSPHRRSTP